MTYVETLRRDDDLSTNGFEPDRDTRGPKARVLHVPLPCRWVDYLRSAISDHAATMESLAPKEKTKRRKSINLAKDAEWEEDADIGGGPPTRPRASSSPKSCGPPAAVVLTSILKKKPKGTVSSMMSWKVHKMKLVKHCRDGQDEDIGPVIQYMSLDGRTFHGAILLDGCTISPKKDKLGMEIVGKNKLGLKTVDVMNAASMADRDAWVAAVSMELDAHTASLDALAPVEQVKRRKSISLAKEGNAADLERARADLTDDSNPPPIVANPNSDAPKRRCSVLKTCQVCGEPKPCMCDGVHQTQTQTQASQPPDAPTPNVQPRMRPPAPAPPPKDDLVVDMATMRSDWSIKQIKKLMIDRGIDTSKCFDKADLVDALDVSEKFHFSPSQYVQPPPVINDEQTPDDKPHANDRMPNDEPCANDRTPEPEARPKKQSSMSKLFSGAKMIVETSSDEDDEEGLQDTQDNEEGDEGDSDPDVDPDLD